jgi:hypothetical protein
VGLERTRIGTGRQERLTSNDNGGEYISVHKCQRLVATTLAKAVQRVRNIVLTWLSDRYDGYNMKKT